MGSSFMEYRIDGHPAVEDAWAALLDQQACGCAGEPGERGRDGHGHFDDCEGVWWVREQSKMEYWAHHPEGGPLTVEQIEWAARPRKIYAAWEAGYEDVRRAEGGYTSASTFPWLALPVGPAETVLGGFTLDVACQDLPPVGEYETRRQFEGPNWQIDEAVWGHVFRAALGDSGLERMVPAGVNVKMMVQATKYVPTGEVTGWCFLGWVR